jgi:tetratricopeptide (TPR) repeat protein
MNQDGQSRSRHAASVLKFIAVWLALGMSVPLCAGQDPPVAGPTTSDIGALMARGDYDALDKVYGEALQQHPQDYRLTYNRALANYLGGHPEKARDILLTVAPLDRSTTEYQALLATVLTQLGDFKSALAPAQEAVRLDSSNPENWLRLGALYLQLKRGQHALDTYQTARGLFPNRPEFLLGKGVVEEMLARLPEAIAVYREVTTKFPLYEPGYCFLGHVQIKSVLPDEARATARDLMRLNSQSAYGEYLLAEADWVTPGNGQQARPHVLRALELNPRLAEAALLAGKVELQAGEPAKAIEYLKQAVQIEPQLEDGYFLLAKAYRQSGDKKQAEIELANFRNLRQSEDKENHLLGNFLASGGPRP